MPRDGILISTITPLTSVHLPGDRVFISSAFHAASTCTLVRQQSRLGRTENGDAMQTVFGGFVGTTKHRGCVHSPNHQGSSSRPQSQENVVGGARWKEDPGAVVGLRDDTAFVVYDTAEWNNVDCSIFCTGSPWISNSGDPVERVRPRPPLRTGSSGVGSEESRTRGFQVTTGGSSAPMGSCTAGTMRRAASSVNIRYVLGSQSVVSIVPCARSSPAFTKSGYRSPMHMMYALNLKYHFCHLASSPRKAGGLSNLVSRMFVVGCGRAASAAAHSACCSLWTCVE